MLRFSVGFGRVLWRRQATPDSTEFVVCALPLGGYVRMLDEREAPVAPAELDRAFNRKPLWQRAAIVAAGPLANLLLAVLLYAAAHWIGIDEPKAVLGAPPRRQRWPSAPACAPATGCARRRATAANGTTSRSLTDLRWQVTQAALQRRDAAAAGQRRATAAARARVMLDLARLDGARRRRRR